MNIILDTKRLPDDKQQRMKIRADFDAETRFRLRAERGRGKAERGLELLRKAMGTDGK
jgi:hypothetical protein